MNPVLTSFAVLAFLGVSLAQYYHLPPNSGGAVGCVVSGKKLFSHGNFIRDLADEEVKELKKYKKELAVFKKKIDEAFANADAVEKANSTIPPMPIRPSMPSFCSKPDTTLYVFAGCTVQNYKVYIGGKFARDLSTKEKKQLDEFAKTVNKPQVSGNGTETATTTVKPDSTKINLDFCTEF